MVFISYDWECSSLKINGINKITKQFNFKVVWLKKGHPLANIILEVMKGVHHDNDWVLKIHVRVYQKLRESCATNKLKPFSDIRGVSKIELLKNR